MKTDFYTKATLTIIAICLLVLAGDKIYKIAVPEAQASDGKATKVTICSPSGRYCGDYWQQKVQVHPALPDAE